MIYLAYFLNFSAMIFMPVLLALWLMRKWRLPGPLVVMGAVTFVASQVGHIPFNWLILQRLQWLPTDTEVLSNLIILALFLGVSAGVFEEVARYITYRFWAKDARTWGRGLMLGIGHGGVEAVLLGMLGLINIGVLMAFQFGILGEGVIPPEQVGLMEAQLAATFDIPWYSVFLGALERLFAITFHLSASLMVMQVFIRKQWFWLGGAILWHTVLNATAVIAVTLWNPSIAELLLGILSLVSLGIIWWLYEPEPVPASSPIAAEELQLIETVNMIEASRYDEE